MQHRVGLCRHSRRVSSVEYAAGEAVVKHLMRTILVEVAQVVGVSLSGPAHRFVRTPVDFFLLETVPDALSSQRPLTSI